MYILQGVWVEKYTPEGVSTYTHIQVLEEECVYTQTCPPYKRVCI